MLCSNPIERKSNKHGEHTVRKTASMLFPCGQCFNCRVNKSRLWANRMLLEMTDHAFSCFVTLTYSDDFLPCFESLQPEDVTKFFKRIRENTGRKLRYYYCGEYGERTGRPHYHIALFGIGQAEKEVIEEAWSYQGVKMGDVFIGELNVHTARYIAGYIMKGANKYAVKSNDEKFKRKIEEHLKGREPEFCRMSRGSAIGAEAVKRFAEVTGGRRFKKINYRGSEFYIGKTLQKKADKVTYSYDNGDSFDIYIDKLFDSFMAEGKNFRESVIIGNSQRRHQREKRHKLFTKRRITAK